MRPSERHLLARSSLVWIGSAVLIETMRERSAREPSILSSIGARLAAGLGVEFRGPLGAPMDVSRWFFARNCSHRRSLVRRARRHTNPHWPRLKTVLRAGHHGQTAARQHHALAGRHRKANSLVVMQPGAAKPRIETRDGSTAALVSLGAVGQTELLDVSKTARSATGRAASASLKSTPGIRFVIDDTRSFATKAIHGESIEVPTAQAPCP